MSSTPGTGPASRAQDVVLAKAVLRAGDILGLARRELAAVIGLSPASVSRLGRGDRSLDPSSKPGELALLLVRLYRGLDALTGGDDAATRAWMRAPNDHLGGTPSELILTARGLVHVIEYLDAMRGRL